MIIKYLKDINSWVLIIATSKFEKAYNIYEEVPFSRYLGLIRWYKKFAHYRLFSSYFSNRKNESNYKYYC